MRFLVRTLINAESDGLRVEDEAANGAEAIAFFVDRTAEVVVLDHMMPGLTGIETARRLLAERPGLRIVLFSAYLDDAVRAEAASAGIVACVDKRDFASIPSMLRAVAA